MVTGGIEAAKKGKAEGKSSSSLYRQESSKIRFAIICMSQNALFIALPW